MCAETEWPLVCAAPVCLTCAVEKREIAATVNPTSSRFFIVHGF